MSDDLEQFHLRSMATDPQYSVARQLLDLGEAVMQLREGAGLSRGQLAKLLGVKAQDVAVVEEETPRAPAGLLETAVRLLVQRMAEPKTARSVEVTDSLRIVRQLRPALLAA
jgi:ribosome-binding protein aMBF1 (putative translation factor)